MELLKENTSRKVDSLGRVSIPKSMRDRLDINEGDEVEFYLLNADNGEQFVCLTNHKPGANKYENAVKVLEELGLDIPKELENWSFGKQSSLRSKVCSRTLKERNLPSSKLRILSFTTARRYHFPWDCLMK